MSIPTIIRSLLSKCKMHGSGDAQVMLSDSELYALICIAVTDLGWDTQRLQLTKVDLPETTYYQIPIEWFYNTDFSFK